MTLIIITCTHYQVHVTRDADDIEKVTVKSVYCFSLKLIVVLDTGPFLQCH